MPTHPHLLIKQSDSPTSNNNISDFMKRLTVTYTLYFNQRHGLSGSLYQGKFRNVRTKTNEQLLYLSKYIHLNPKSPSKHPHSSLPIFIGQSPTPKWLHPEEILELNYYKNSTNPQKNYQNFIFDSKPTPKSISQLTLE
ncbi:transposase [Patescibacteria group bacterium]|nr:transposase [Patescibacteria group bacterium]